MTGDPRRHRPSPARAAVLPRLRLPLPLLLLLVLSAAAVAQPPPPGGPRSDGPSSEVTLEQIMADPDWIGNPPEKPYWADDGRAVYYDRKRQGGPLRDLYRLRLGERQPRLVADAERGAADAAGGDVSRDRKWKAYVREGDVFLKDLGTGAVRQLTRTPDAKSEPKFMAGGGRISFRVKNTYFIYDLGSGLLSQPADLRLAKDPAPKPPKSFLAREQLRLFGALREDREHKQAERERAEAAQRADPTRPPLPWYLGTKIAIDDVSLAPSGDWLLLVAHPKSAKEGKKAVVPHYVTDTGYVDPEAVRPLVGTGSGTDSATGKCLVLLDLRYHQRHDLDLSTLPGIADDPLKALRDAAAARAKALDAAAANAAAAAGRPAAPAPAPVAGAAATGAPAPPSLAAPPPQPGRDAAAAPGNACAAISAAAAAGEDEEQAPSDAPAPAGPATDAPGSKDRPEGGPPSSPALRPVEVLGVAWTVDGRRAAVELVALDHKDRWIATLDLDGPRLVPRHRETDGAWINWEHNTMGWLADDETLYFESEESGYNHLYALTARDGRIRQLTAGKFEIHSPEPSYDGRTLYFVANAGHPGNYDAWRVEVATGKSEQLSRLGGLTGFWPSLDERQLLIIHSSIDRHDELYVQPNRPGAEARRVTDTITPAFLAVSWTLPDVVAIPSSHGAGVIYSRVYTPPPDAARPAAAAVAAGASRGKRPAVVFIHGAGYLQDAHYGWSYYFHEFMFHTFLTRQGYVVLDMDYRASAGYGRDWRTAIYRQMGHPELEDLQDGVDWLVRNRDVDRARVGVYGGSYGGFLTLMALFRKPDLFAAGAALRPVTDWSDYNDEYTGAILNTPEVDPEAFERSSPIEFAAGLSRPLLICHGVVDDNVLFQDSVRLVQRLIELEKQDFQIAPYPVERHGFMRPSSWLDEYRRIYKLMAGALASPAGAAAAAPAVRSGAGSSPASPR
jgi:dipeptidyl aminopeptidase/acylaminoacyl peptidase